MKVSDNQFAEKNHSHGGYFGCLVFAFLIAFAIGGTEWLGKVAHAVVMLADSLAATPGFQAGWNSMGPK